MAEKNQQSLANGIPQLQAANELQSNYNNRLGEIEAKTFSEVNYNSYSNHSFKPLVSMVNGQISQNVPTSNQQPQTAYFVNNLASSAEDNVLQQKTNNTNSAHQQSSAVNTTTNSNLSQTSNLRLDTLQNISTPVTYSNSSVHSSISQMTSSVQSSRQNIVKPTPLVAIRPNTSSSGFYQFSQKSTSACTTTQPLISDSILKTSPVNLVHQGKPVTNMTSHAFQPQNSKVVNGPPNPINIAPKTSPYNRPMLNLSDSTTLPQNTFFPPTASQKTITSENQNYQKMYPPSNFMMSNPTSFHSFGPQTTQPLSLRPEFSENFQPQQPLVTSTNNQHQTLYKTSVPNALNRENPIIPSNPPTSHETYCQNQYPGRMVPPPPLAASSMQPPPSPQVQEVPPFKNKHNLIPNSPTNILPPCNFNSNKHPGMNVLSQGMERMSVTQQGYNKLWGIETVDLLQCRNVLPPQKVTPPPIRLHQEFMDSVNCSPEIFCCTLNKIPETNSLLQKSRLPLGILLHPFRDLSQLAVIQCSSIVRCRACRTYINPFVYFVDNKRWKCNLCFRVNELPDEFQFDPVSKTYGDPSRRPEVRSSTIEFIAPSEYMLRPPQPAIYLFVLDVSRWGCDSGYLETLCSVLLEELDNIPGDSRTQMGFILFDSTIHFFSIAENYNQAHEMIVTDIDDVFLPTADSLLVNLNENRQLIKDLLCELPKKYTESFDTDSALGPALQAAYKLMSPTGGRITVFQSCLPNKGPGALNAREDHNRSSKDVRNLGPQTDFYKRLSLDCSTQQIAVDLFLVSSQYSDLATLGGISQFSGGCIYYFPLYRRINLESNERLDRALRRYLTRKIGFEAVMRVRCSRGLTIHTFHGNFFVRSTDLLSLPNVNPDAGFGMQIAIEDSLTELQCVCFQAAILYTSAKGERRIRVHTLCLPVSSNLSDILTSADQQAIVGLLSKMAVDRSLKSSLSDAREAFINAAIDILSAYKLVETSGPQNSILAPVNLSLIPLYVLALLKSVAFRTGHNTRLDDRVFAMSQLKTLPLRDLIQMVHPDLYHVTHLDDQTGVEFEDKMVAQPARLSLSSEHLDSRGAFLIDTPDVIYLLIGKNISQEFLINIFDVREIAHINKDLVELPELENKSSEKLRHFIIYLQAEKPWPAIVKVVIEPNTLTQFFINDKAENALSYYELLHHIKAQLK